MNKPNILIVHNYYQIAGGEDTVVKNEKALLESNGHKVITYFRNNSEINEFSVFQKLLLPFTSIYSLKTYREVKKIIINNKIDIVHVHNTLSLVSPSVYYAAFRCNIPVVQTLHNFRMLCPGGSFFRDNSICEECIRGGLRCAVKHSCYRDSKVQTMVSSMILKIHRILGTYRRINYICLTQFNKDKILQINAGNKKIIDSDKVYIKPNFTYDYLDNVKKLDDKTDNNYFVYAGRLEKLKGIELLIDAFEKMPQHRLVIVGSGPLEEKVAKRIADNRCDNIQLKGYAKGNEYSDIIMGAKAIVVTSQCYETFGMTIAEAFSYGVPAIVGDVGNIKNMVCDGVTGVQFKYNSSQSLISAVDRFCSMNRQELAHNARKYYEENLRPDSNYSILEGIYECIMSGNRKERKHI